MPVRKDDERRWVEMEVLVPGTPEQVWQAMATGPGMSAWFTTTTVEEHVGGAIRFEFGDSNCGQDVSSGKVTEWEPPTRLRYEEYGWSGDAPPVATEITVTSRSGDTCVVRMVHSLFTERDDWDDELESFETGWPGFFEILKVYLSDFAGQPSATVRAMAGRDGGDLQAWTALTGALNLTGVNVGERRETPSDAPRLAGTVARVHQDRTSREVMLRVDEPAPGAAVIGLYPMGDTVQAMVSVHLYGPDAADRAEGQRQVWRDWLQTTLTADAVAT